MTARAIRREVDQERWRLSDLERQVEAAEAMYRAEVTKSRGGTGPLNERYDEGAVSRARSRRAALKGQYEDTQVRIDTLLAQLPPAEQVQQALTEAKRLVTQIPRCDELLAEAWTQLKTETEALEVAARAVPPCRHAQLQVRSQVWDLVERFDLDVIVPPIRELDRHDVAFALIVGLLVKHVLEGAISIDPQVETMFASARAERDHVVA